MSDNNKPVNLVYKNRWNIRDRTDPDDLIITLPFGNNGSYDSLTDRPMFNDKVVEGNHSGEYYGLQDLLVSGENIKTINGESILGEGNIEIEGGGGGQLQSDLVVSNPLGRYTMDEVIDSGTTFETIFRGLLSKTYYPTLTDPSVSIAYGATTLMKVGAMVPALKATLTFNRGSINPQYTAESPYRAGEATGYSVSLTGANIQYSESGEENQFNIPTFTRESAGNVILNASASYGEGAQPKDSDGADYKTPLPAGSKSASKTIEFILPFYWGKDKLASLVNLDDMTEDLSKKSNKTYTYAGADDEYLYIAYSAAYGNLKSILDENNFENIDSWVRSELGHEGHNYIVYRSGFSITGSPSFTFKF